MVFSEGRQMHAIPGSLPALPPLSRGTDSLLSHLHTPIPDLANHGSVYGCGPGDCVAAPFFRKLAGQPRPCGGAGLPGGQPSRGRELQSSRHSQATSLPSSSSSSSSRDSSSSSSSSGSSQQGVAELFVPTHPHPTKSDWRSLELLRFGVVV